ncbi:MULTISPECIES: hypothetical protein [Rhizobium]|nr:MULTISPECIES: hypothetical protein [Rhizobium]MBB3285439.1 hypothetical protein [Rhizobium sp. BK252]MBB3400179.1 hypothetical protein [Rhizobium sp. BK289]MBB3412758.1 hypothetical protein [Rhizobium sp. BK284]MBB3480645.1 hypothetical protein [Rhizobium sp. BK347]MDK4719304.1 hypothetical protein [Rhizobium sp. CNPSo 3968]
MTDSRRENSQTTAERNTGSRSHRPAAANQTKGELDAASEHAKERGPDDLPNIEATKEAVRQHDDAFIVKSDLEDADEREASPGTREQP